MFESLISMESLLAISVGAIVSFRISKLNVDIRSDVRNQSPNINGNNNQVVYNEVMMPIRKEMAFSVKVCAFVMMVLFHMYPFFFIKLTHSLSFILPILSLIGVASNFRVNGFSQFWNVLYPIASFVMGGIFYCSAIVMLDHVTIYPQLTSLFDSLVSYGFKEWMGSPHEMQSFVLIIFSSVACPLLIVAGFYLAFAHTEARDGNKAFAFSFFMLISGYVAYVFLSGFLFSPDQNIHSTSLLSFPFRYILSFFPH
ncbi:hypothetical protein [Kosakonia cowanii]|uniref:hypothetical protein n=1 Tax=Kosakonia cowanii TaxID=208223 RepID=UPI00320B831A